MHGPRLARQGQQYMRLHIQKIVRALAQARIIECLERGDGTPGRPAPGERSALAGRDQLPGRFVQYRVVEKFHVRGDDPLARGAACISHAFQPAAHVGSGSFELIAFMTCSRTKLDDCNFTAFNAGSTTHRKTGHRAYAGEFPVLRRTSGHWCRGRHLARGRGLVCGLQPLSLIDGCNHRGDGLRGLIATGSDD